jgi:pyrroline-5-carboxylate reductase
MGESDKKPRVGFIGAGKMATALARGLCQSGFTSTDRVLAADVVAAACTQFVAVTGGKTVDSNVEVAEKSDILVIAVKPQYVRQVLLELEQAIRARHLVLSIAAGISLSTIAELIGSQRRIVRVMPNTPCLVGSSASAYSLGGQATRDDAETTARLLGSVGLGIELPESLLDAVTGLSGSGPAFVYVMIEALADGGVKAGLPRDVALKLAAQTVMGAARMVLETGEHPGALKDAVASPGGTTIAGLHEIERGALRACLMSAVEAAARRSRELGQPNAPGA